MKKRIFMLALVVGVMLSVCVSAWAVADSIGLSGLSAGYSQVKVSTERIGKEFTIAVKAGVGSYEQPSTATYCTNAAYLKWTVEATDNTVGSLKITSVNGDTEDTAAYDAVSVSTAPTNFSANITGTIEGAGTITVTVTLVQSDKTAQASAGDTELTGEVVQRTFTITFSDAEDADDVKTTGTEGSLFTDSTENPDLFDTYDAADPDSVSWDGLDPTFSNTIKKTSYDIGKNKPKLGKIEKANLTFTPGTAKDLEVPMTGPIELVDVYIAQKDAKKLYPASADSITADIRLTSASIKAYKIPFRVTSYDFAKTVTGSTTKEIQKAWKSAENSLTLSFNGSKMQYKGFPLTIEMSNSNNTSKPTKKAIKLNIGSDFTTPAWTYKATSYDTTTDEDTYTAWEADEDTVEGSTGEVHTYTSTGEEQTTITAPDGTATGATFNVDGYDTLYILSTDNKVYVATDLEHYYYRYVYVTKTVDKKDKLEASTWVNDSAAGTADDHKAGEIERIFYASADAPYAITLKPDLTKDAAKITKFFTSAASIDVVQPVYDYLGNVKTHGYVKIQGVPKETSKESKLAFTLTATNPSTKKKGAAKVTANAKTFPEIDKTSNVTITAAQQDDWDGAYDPEYYVTREGSTAEDGSITYKRATVKRVEAGKVPSVKVKAKGSKTISYKLGKYTVDDDGNVDETDYEDFNATMLANLKALKLSFDEKKGAVVLLDKSDKATKPTLNSDGDAFESLDIVITAVNNVGYDQAWAHVAITGAKPKMADKSVTVEGTQKLGDTITFKVLAGKTAAETLTDGSANVKVYAADSTAAKTLSDYGLALVPYDSMDVIVSKEVTFAVNATIPAYDAEKNPIVKNTTYYSYYSDDDATTLVTEGDTPVIFVEAAGDTAAYYKAGSNGVTLLSGDTWAKSADTSLKNYGILQVIDPEALAKVSKDKTANKGVSVNLTLENLGATNKGKLKVIIKDTVDGGDPLDPVVTTTTTETTEDTSTETAGAAPKTNGTASLTYNGALPEDADAEEAAKGTVTFGAPRTVADLTADQQAFLAEKGYTVVAVLPEITADVSDQYKLENIELDEEAPEGATLIWIAFPKNAPASEDDEIVDFYDEAGTPVEGVPASHKIIAEPWLREGVTYEPVIAIEAK